MIVIDRAKLHRVLQSIEAKDGHFILAALFMREDSAGLWDLVVSAPWLRRGRLAALKRFAKRLTAALSQDEILSLSRIVRLNREDPALKKILKELGSVTEPVEKVGRNLFGLPVEHAYVFRARGRALSDKAQLAAPRARRGQRARTGATR